MNWATPLILCFNSTSQECGRSSRRNSYDGYSGGVPMGLSSRSGGGGSVVGAVAEHGVEDIAAAAGQC